MDTQTNERVLQTIFEIKKSDVLSRPVPKLQEKLPDLSKEIIESSIENLDKQGYLEMKAGDEIFHIIVKPSAIGYIREIEEQRNIENTQKCDNRKWDIKRTILASVLSFISGAILTFIALKLK